MKDSDLFEMTLANLIEKSNMSLQSYFAFVEKCRKMDNDEVIDPPEDYEGDV